MSFFGDGSGLRSDAAFGIATLPLEGALARWARAIRILSNQTGKTDRLPGWATARRLTQPPAFRTIEFGGVLFDRLRTTIIETSALRMRLARRAGRTPCKELPGPLRAQSAVC